MHSFPSLLAISRILETSSSQHSFTARKEAFCCSTTQSNSAISCIEKHAIKYTACVAEWLLVPTIDRKCVLNTKAYVYYIMCTCMLPNCLTWVSWRRKGYVSTKDPMENWSESSSVLWRKRNILAIKSSMALGSGLVWKYTMRSLNKYKVSANLWSLPINFWSVTLSSHATGSR